MPAAAMRVRQKTRAGTGSVMIFPKIAVKDKRTTRRWIWMCGEGVFMAWSPLCFFCEVFGAGEIAFTT